MRLRTFFAVALLTAASAPAFAQNGIDSIDNIFSWPTLPPGPALSTAATPNPQFPLRVWLRVDHNHWNDENGGYSGYGKFTFASQTTSQPAPTFIFEYGCPSTFADPLKTEFQARWITPGKKLQVLLVDAYRPDKTHTCNLTTVAREPRRLPRRLALAYSETYRPR